MSTPLTRKGFLARLAAVFGSLAITRLPAAITHPVELPQPPIPPVKPPVAARPKVRVKPLVWKDGLSAHYHGVVSTGWIGDASRYAICQYGASFTLYVSGLVHVGDYPTLQSARDAAQTHWDAIVLAAIEEVDVVEGQSTGLQWRPADFSNTDCIGERAYVGANAGKGGLVDVGWYYSQRSCPEKGALWWIGNTQVGGFHSGKSGECQTVEQARAAIAAEWAKMVGAA